MFRVTTGAEFRCGPGDGSAEGTAPPAAEGGTLQTPRWKENGSDEHNMDCCCREEAVRRVVVVCSGSVQDVHRRGGLCVYCVFHRFKCSNAFLSVISYTDDNNEML